MTDLEMKHCKRCGKVTQHLKPSTSHVLHLLLSLISVGLWLPFWFLIAMSNNSQGQCTHCGRKKGILN